MSDTADDFRASRNLPRSLSFFPGPMAENAGAFNSLLESIVTDHEHWRRNYFPRDGQLFNGRDQRRAELDHAELEDSLRSLLAELRRSFPFHSPRYVAHQQSELSMPALLGSFAGSLYNSNHVTPESANATLPLELEAAAQLLEMIGYTPPPVPPTVPPSQEAFDIYHRAAAQEYGWAHLCSGGTSANIEALWVARNVRYKAIAIVEALRITGIDVEFRSHPGAAPCFVSELPDEKDQRARAVLAMRPSCAVDLLADAFEKAGDQRDVLWSALDKESRPWFELMTENRPVVLVSGAAHYSIKKAMDVLGLGTESIRTLKTDSRYRVDPDHLRSELDRVDRDGEFPLAVVGVVGTTEEGAIDPIHRIVEIRAEREAAGKSSFWIHSDAAWGGYFLSLLRPAPEEQFTAWADSVAAQSAEIVAPIDSPYTARPFDGFTASLFSGSADGLMAVREAISTERWDHALALCELHAERTGVAAVDSAGVSRASASDQLRSSRQVRVESPNRPPYRFRTEHRLNGDTFDALEAICLGDSVTVDPHKMGYQPYACGAVAFQRDGVRDFIRREAPYITKAAGRELVRQPLWHLRADESDPAKPLMRVVDAPSPFTLEGSRPSSPALGLWLSLKVLPLHRRGHGRLVASTWTAANEFASFIERFSDYRDHLLPSADADARKVDFVVLTRSGSSQGAPDTNLVIFGATVSGGITLAEYNELNERIHKAVFITPESGGEEFSYSQPYFVSSTKFESENYCFDAVEPAARALDITDFEERYANGSKMMVLRATIMNPYLQDVTRRNPDREPYVGLMEHLATAAQTAWKQIERSKADKGSADAG